MHSGFALVHVFNPTARMGGIYMVDIKKMLEALGFDESEILEDYKGSTVYTWISPGGLTQATWTQSNPKYVKIYIIERNDEGDVTDIRFECEITLHRFISEFITF